jgi:hypothetical protein
VTRDDAKFLAAAEQVGSALCKRASDTYKRTNTITLSHDEFSELAIAFDRAVQLAIESYLTTTEGA